MGGDPMYDLQTLRSAVRSTTWRSATSTSTRRCSYAAPQVVYAGSIDRVDFGEQDEDKGWVYVEIAEKGRAEWRVSHGERRGRF